MKYCITLFLGLLIICPFINASVPDRAPDKDRSSSCHSYWACFVSRTRSNPVSPENSKVAPPAHPLDNLAEIEPVSPPQELALELGDSPPNQRREGSPTTPPPTRARVSVVAERSNDGRSFATVDYNDGRFVGTSVYRRDLCAGCCD